MSSIIWNGDTFHGISVESRGVFKYNFCGNDYTYAGQCKDGYACGLGVATWPSGLKVYAEYGPDGKCDGRHLGRWPGGTTRYSLFERGGKQKDSGDVFDDGRCKYNGEFCAPDDPRVLALIAQVAPVEVRPAAPAPHPLLGPPLRPQAIGRLVLPPQALAKAVATEVHPHAARRRLSLCDPTQPSIALQSTTTQKCMHGPIRRSGQTGAPLAPLTTAAWCTPRARPGSSVAMP
jgi:hypothetical protein